MSIKTILFDLDGTLLDSNELINASFKHTFKTFNFPITSEQIKTFNGPPLRKTFKSFDPERVDDMIKTYREFNISHHDDYVTVFPKVMETIDQLANKDIQMAIVTNKVRDVVKLGLSLTGLDQYFTPKVVITLDDVKHSKPHPEAVIKAMEIVNSDPKSTLMVGDNFHDIEAGHHAGVKTAGVAWSDKGRDFLQQYKPTYMLESMTDLLRLI